MKLNFCLLVMSLCVWTWGAPAKEIEKIDFPEEMSVGSQKLVLNGVGLRTKKKLGMNFKVYVAGLYLPAKMSDLKRINENKGNKVLELVFLRSLDRETLQEAWSEGFNKNCGDAAACEAAKDHLKAFNDVMIDVSENSRLKMTFDKDGVTVDVKTLKKNKSAQVMGDAFKNILLGIFIGAQPPTEDLKKGLLGL